MIFPTLFLLDEINLLPESYNYFGPLPRIGDIIVIADQTYEVLQVVFDLDKEVIEIHLIEYEESYADDEEYEEENGEEDEES